MRPVIAHGLNIGNTQFVFGDAQLAKSEIFSDRVVFTIRLTFAQ